MCVFLSILNTSATHAYQFIEKYVLNGELDKIYNKNNTSKNIIPCGKTSN